MLFQKMFMSGLFVFHNHCPNQGAFYYFLTREFLFGSQHIKKKAKTTLFEVESFFSWCAMGSNAVTTVVGVCQIGYINGDFILCQALQWKGK